MGAVLVTHIAAPVVIPCIPKVTRKEGIPIRVTNVPLIEPTTKPVNNPARIPGTRPNLEITIAVITEAKPATEPTDRSISAVARTKVIATAITEMMADCRMIFSRLLLLRKPLWESVAEKVTNTIMKVM